MNISCNVIRDILPLYAEDMVCDETKKLVDEHLCGCDACTKELGRLKKKEAIPVSTDTAPMEHIRKTIRKRQILTTVCVILTIVSLIWSGMVYMTAPIYLTAEQAFDSIKLREDGGLDMDFGNGYDSWTSYYSGKADRVIYVKSTRGKWREEQKEDRAFQAMTQEEQEAYLKNRYRVDEVEPFHYDMFNRVEKHYYFQNEEGQFFDSYGRGDSEILLPSNEKENVTLSQPNLDIWYEGPDGKHGTLLWQGGDGEFQGKEEDLPLVARQTVLLTFLFGLGFVVIGGGAAWFLRKSKWKYLPLVFAAYGGSLMIFALIVSGGNMTGLMGSGLAGWNEHFVSTTLILTVTALLWLYRHDINKKGSF